jgi:23S rRNA pseudouridine1911/1915/1917 synthase
VSLAESLDILLEDNHCLALNKPCGWPTTHFEGREETVDRLAKTYLKEKYQKPGNVFLGVVHWLDKPVSGVLLFARTSKAAARLAEQFREGAVEKVYWAVIDGDPSCLAAKEALRPDRANASQLAGTLEDWLVHDDAKSRVEVVPRETPGAKHASLHYEVRARYGGLSLLELRPQTGRKHQLRVQFAARGLPIYGDCKYGSPHSFGDGIALHARSLTFLHPTRQEPTTIIAEAPKLWRSRFAHLLAPEPPR